MTGLRNKFIAAILPLVLGGCSGTRFDAEILEDITEQDRAALTEVIGKKTGNGISVEIGDGGIKVDAPPLSCHPRSALAVLACRG